MNTLSQKEQRTLDLMERSRAIAPIEPVVWREGVETITQVGKAICRSTSTVRVARVRWLEKEAAE